MAAAVGILAAVLGLEFLLFGDQVARNLQVLLTHRSAARGVEPLRPAPLPVLAPPAAGDVSQVELRPLDTCRGGEPCPVLLQVALQPHERPLQVTWRFEVVDRCRRSSQTRPGGTASVPPGQDRLVQSLTVALPPGQSLAVIPVTSEPGRVAGPAMQLPGAGGC